MLARPTKAWLFSLLWLSSAFAHADSVVGIIPPPVEVADLLAEFGDPPVEPMPQYRSLWSARVNEEMIRRPAAAIRLNGPGMPEVVVPILRWQPRAGYIQIYNDDNPDQPITIPDPNALPEDFSWHWYGKSGYTTVSLTVERGVLAGRIWLRDRRYSLRPSEGGLLLGETNSAHWRMHPETSEPNLGGNTPFGEFVLSLPAPPVTPRGSWDYSCSGPVPTEYHNIDVLVLYSLGVFEEFGFSHPNVVASLRAAIDDSNNAVRNSGIQTFLYHLRHAELLPNSGAYDQQPIDEVLYSFSGVQPLGVFPDCQIASSSDVLDLRDQYQADVVALARRDQRPVPECGYTFIQRRETRFCAFEPGEDFNRFAFLVFDPECNADRLNLAHELGHQLGADHDPRNYSISLGSTASCPWSVGHRIADQTDGFRTVMSTFGSSLSGPGTDCDVDLDCPMIDAFSTTALQWTGAGGLQPANTSPTAELIGVPWPPPDGLQAAQVADTLQRLAPYTAAFQARTDLIHAHGFE